MVHLGSVGVYAYRVMAAASVLVWVLAVGVASAERPVDFNRDIRPILSENCFHCHGPDSATRESGLRLDDAESAADVLPAKGDDDCELLRRVLSDDPDEQMPPPESRKSLKPGDRDLIRRWIESGAPLAGHWSFERPVRAATPVGDDWCRDEIDAFVLARIRQQGLQPSEPASREAYIRRVTLDLTGLPPTLDQVDSYLADTQPAADLRLVERLMRSHRYGEQMALPWLEAARYADTDGYQNDRYRYQHAWRDWVIDAYNQNLPYDQFVVHQIAGDMLPEATLAQQIASGFGRNHRINSEDGSIPEEWRVENVVDRVDTFGTVFLGLTVGCARCHDHKYDPISQREYYQLFAYFNNIAEWGVGPNNGNTPPFITVPDGWPAEWVRQSPAIVPGPVELHGARKESGNGLKRPQAGDPTTVMVMHELDQPRETFVLQRGVYNMPDKTQPLAPGVPAALGHLTGGVPKDRLQLARWLVDPDHPLTARVVVNRMWQQFFGVGLVSSSDNFGSQGATPTHPELLDYLAIKLIESGWDLQTIQKRILLSATYRQSSVATVDRTAVDPQNQFLARGPRVRLPAFTLRDQALAVSGLLFERVGGPSAKPYMPPKIWSAISNNKYTQDRGGNLYRRSLYTYWRRTIPPPTMMNFNAAAREVCTVQTETTNTPLQALTLMNNITFVEAARGLAARVMRDVPRDLDQQILVTFRTVTSRLPSEQERKLLKSAYDDFSERYRASPGEAKKLLGVGQSPRDETLDVTAHAALTMTASLILNLDETITKE